MREIGLCNKNYYATPFQPKGEHCFSMCTHLVIGEENECVSLHFTNVVKVDVDVSYLSFTQFERQC